MQFTCDDKPTLIGYLWRDRTRRARASRITSPPARRVPPKCRPWRCALGARAMGAARCGTRLRDCRKSTLPPANEARTLVEYVPVWAQAAAAIVLAAGAIANVRSGPAGASRQHHGCSRGGAPVSSAPAMPGSLHSSRSNNSCAVRFAPPSRRHPSRSRDGR